MLAGGVAVQLLEDTTEVTAVVGIFLAALEPLLNNSRLSSSNSAAKPLPPWIQIPGKDSVLFLRTEKDPGVPK